MELTPEEIEFKEWLLQFVAKRGHTFDRGFYVLLKEPDGRLLYNISQEYKDWYKIKIYEYLRLKK